MLSQLARLADPRWRQFYVQRRFMSAGVRDRVADWLAARRPSPVHTERDAGHADDLRTTGLVNLGRLLTAEQCAELVTHFSKLKVRDHYRPESGEYLPDGSERHPLSHTAFHSDADVIAAPYLLEIANDPKIIGILSRYFGCVPVISYMAAWWSYPTDAGPQQAENFHRDVDDWRFIKLFVYLTDVTEETGPHIYVRGSAASPKERRIKRYTDPEIHAAFGRQALAVQVASAGSAFLENTFGFHKGMQVGQGRRLLFQAVYSLNRIPYGPAKPILPLEGRLPPDETARHLNGVYLS